ncbi:ATP-dependent helicase/nuclease subunit B [Pullulanibacillus pueri]|uniref:ATP-dependent helicase/deoxyribonuclease subunit B n=1 Tax=Pullulanibacillus pueri TaxID=1437324 RepID=A0A8J3EP49_9BACL|nr:helicase-exonuclease AddAB subunit AddB [Pullulanibacillus pueri]MBM7680537.1 ATP-dependent helicase/nuclease subunit B [Pullulanibacillus pueri]GGH86154.1 ATP-dependent helicase/deoxyribonuclease subunit B [Pullulanibacillus pueri]
MSFRLIIGRAGTGKTLRCFTEIEERLREAPDGSPLLYIVPDQMTFHTEYAFAKLPGLEGMTRLDVYSFSRLALRILENVGGASRLHLNSVGITMLLRKIITTHKNDLKVFQKAAGQQGFYEILQQTISEFKRYSLSSEDLKEKWEHLNEETQGNETLLVDKLHDLQLIYNALDQALLDKYVDSDDYLTLATEQLPKWEALQTAEVWIDGFERFTPQEQGLLSALMQQARRVTVTLTLDKVYEEPVPYDLTLFRATAATCGRLLTLAREAEVDIERPEELKTVGRFKAKSLAHLESTFEKRPFLQTANDGSIQLIEAVNRREEIEAVAREVLHLVRDKGYRYQDISVLVRDLSSYRDHIETIFTDYHLPVFIDQKRTMHHHPLIELMRSALDTVLQNWRYEAVFRALKTELLYPSDYSSEVLTEAVDRLENHVLAFGIHGPHWKNKAPWIYRQYRGLEEKDVPQTAKEKALQDDLNHWRWLLADPLLTFERKIKQAKTVRAKCTELYQFLEALDVPAKIESMRNLAEEEGRLDEAREHDQVWKAVLDCLDQLVEVAGDDVLSLEAFAEVLGSGLEALRFALVPPALDQILIGAIDRSRTNEIKAAFILGVNEGILPAKPVEDSIFSDEERETLGEQALELSPNGREQLLHEEFLIYRALTSPSEKLYLFYPLAGEDGQSLMPSSLVSRMSRYFTQLEPEFISGDPYETETSEQEKFIVASSRTLGHVAGQIRRWQKGYPVADLWWSTYNWLIQSEQWRQSTQQVLSSRFYVNKEERLPKETSQDLYGKDIQASVSRMELFNSCPFAQFANYGLRLKDREIYKLEAPDIGQLFHAALKQMTEELLQQNKQWSELSRLECESLAFDMVERLAPRLQREILLSSSRYFYLKRKMRDVVVRAALAMNRHAKASGFSPVGIELPFGPNQPLPPLDFKLPNGSTMQIVGRIDRVDKGVTSKGLLLRIIDYKSSAKDLSMTDVYYGIALQMLAYLDVVITHSKTWLGEEADPAGVLYFHVHNPMLNEKDKPEEEALESRLFKEFKMKGLLIEDEEALRLMDEGLESKRSDIIPVAFKKDGSFTKQSSIAADEDFDVLRQYVRGMMQKVGTEITEGNIGISPYKLKDRTPCTYCSFKSLCQFDLSRPENAYRMLKKSADAEVLVNLKESLNSQDVEEKKGEGSE